MLLTIISHPYKSNYCSAYFALGGAKNAKAVHGNFVKGNKTPVGARTRLHTPAHRARLADHPFRRPCRSDGPDGLKIPPCGECQELLEIDSGQGRHRAAHSLYLALHAFSRTTPKTAAIT